MSLVAGVAGGIIANYISTILIDSSEEGVHKFIPAFFSKGNDPFLRAAEAKLNSAIAQLRKKYERYPAVKRMLNVKDLSHVVPIKMTLDEILLGAEFEDGVSDKFILDFQDKDDRPKIQNVRKITIDVNNTLKSFLLSSPKTAPFVMQRSIEELKTQINGAINEFNSIKARLDLSDDPNISEFTCSYVISLIRNIEDIIIHGLDAMTRREQIKNRLISSFVPIYVSGRKNSREGEVWRGDAEDAFENLNKLTIRGAAGSGKTTFLHWLTLNSVDVSVIDSSKIKQRDIKYIPIFIPLRRIQSLLRQNLTINDALLHTMPTDSLASSIPFEWLKKLYASHPKLVFMFDGVDEVRSDLRSFVWDLVKEVCRDYPNSKVIVTSRNLSEVHLSDGSYRQDVFENEDSYLKMRSQWRLPSSFFEFSVSPLKNVEIINFVEKWFLGVNPEILPPAQRDEVSTYPEQLKTELFLAKNKHALELSRTPLLCALICMVFFLKKGNLPKSKRELYELATKLLVQSRDEQRGVDVEPLFIRFDHDDRVSMLKHIALSMQEGALEGKQDQTIEVDKAAVLKWLEAYIKNEASQFKFSPEQVIKFFIERCTIIREPAQEKIDFVHRSFMEYLSADEIVLKRNAHSIRHNIRKDEWIHTLQFCMDTQHGGASFGGNLIEEMFECVKATPGVGKRALYIRILSLLQYMNKIPVSFHDNIEEIFSHVHPVTIKDEVSELIGIPAVILHKFLDVDTLGEKLDDDGLYSATRLLSMHPSLETKQTLLTGYHNIADHKIIEILNRSGKLSLEEHTALKKRVINGSYKNMVMLRTTELANREIRKRFVRHVGILFPPNSKSFVGWDFLNRCTKVEIHNLTNKDIEFMLKSVNKQRFDSCKNLELYYPNNIDMSLLERLFPSITELEIIRPTSLNLTGLDKCEHLKNLWIVGCNQELHLTKGMFGESLVEVFFSSSANPIKEDDLDITVTVDDHGIDKRLYVPNFLRS